MADSLYVGLMSGTSMDAIDAALVSFGDHVCQVIAVTAETYPKDLRKDLMAASRNPNECSIEKVGQLDRAVGECFRDAVLNLLRQTGIDASSVTAIGSHGQTLRHEPKAKGHFSLQIGDPNIIATGTGITTIADFRRGDIAAGGEGAPLTPAFHQWLFMDATKRRTVLNIGGIANITILNPSNKEIIGFDTGPGNILLDGWSLTKKDEAYDVNGTWACEGTVNETLLSCMLADPYFRQAPPKSTGFEYFNNRWTAARIASLGKLRINATDIQSTLAELTAQTISASIQQFASNVEELLVCGGGVHNKDLLQRLQSCLSGVEIISTEECGVHPDWVEATAFAWLAKRCLEQKPGNLPAVTGADREVVLGAIHMKAS